MKTIAYLQFEGKAEEALSFYEKALAAKVKKVRFSALGPNPNLPLTEEEQNMIMEASVEFFGNTLMLSDVLPSMQAVTGPLLKGNAILISLIDGSPDENRSIFQALSEKGTVIMPLSSTPWSDSFGMLVDRFGVIWKFNGEASKFLDGFV
ncbi:VOC family protein [Planococcus sp. 107-1]|uniref:VOC family protein n=1 Tax=Planococcus sp. 107-1 TaxID=2908840 RepID=UPI001F3F8E92|nr:VOC family protein [Planococcus sp. 107-1]UJF25529.1 VOC family protein [Planococcus sp. 107-1]